jgi:hypothetical protein
VRGKQESFNIAIYNLSSLGNTVDPWYLQVHGSKETAWRRNCLCSGRIELGTMSAAGLNIPNLKPHKSVTLLSQKLLLCTLILLTKKLDLTSCSLF